MVTRPYDHPNHTIMREFHQQDLTGTGGYMRTAQTGVLDAVYGVVATAGTTGSTTVIVTAGTTVFGTATIGTDTAGSTFSITGTELPIVANTDEVYMAISDATGHVDITYVWHVDPDNTVI